MVSLEEQFPELKNIHYYVTENDDIEIGKDDFKKLFLSKQKVENIMDNFEMNHQRELNGWHHCRDLLKKELGL